MVTTPEIPFITKVLIPRRRDYTVRRDRLLGPMTERVDKKVQVVCAPAGYGKTALLVDFADAVGLQICWYSFSPEDHDPISFLRYCVQSVRARYPEFGASCISLLRGTAKVDQHSLVGMLTTELHNELSDRLVFMFDDVHWTDGKEELEEALSLLIERSPPKVHFVLGSRTRPSLACLAKLTVQDELGSIDADDLRFSTEETTQLLTHLWERPVTSIEAEQVQGQTRGWAAGIVLIRKSQTLASSPVPVMATDEGVLFNYLSHEVLEQLPSTLRSFLLKTSVLREFTLVMCDSLLDRSDSEQFINQIKMRSLFLEERAGQAAAYKYHDLFREFLEHQFRLDHLEEYKHLNLRAAALYTDLGDDDAAIYHFLRSGEPDRAIEIVKKVSDVYYAQGHWERLASWLGRLPPGAVEGDSDLLLLRGQVTLRLGNPTGSLEQLEKLVAGPHGDDPEVLGKALVAKSTAYRRLGYLDLAVKAAGEGLSLLQENRCPREHIAEAHKQLGSAFNTKGEYERAKENFQSTLSLINMENLRLFSLTCNDLGVTYLELGELDQAAMYLERAKVGLLKLGSDGPMAEAMINLALVYYNRGEFDLAMDEVGEALRVAQSAGYPRVVATGFMIQSVAQHALKAYTDSKSSASQALKLARELLDHRLIAESTEALGNAYRSLDETSIAEVLLNQAVLEGENSGDMYVTACNHISLGKIYCQLCSYGPAIKHFSLAEAQLTELKSLRRVAETKLYQAAIYYRTNKLKDAMEYLTQVADIVSQIGYDGYLLADGYEVLDALRYGAAKRVGGDTYTRLVGRLTQKPAGQKRTTGGKSGADGLSRYPTIRAFSLGLPRVFLDTHEVTDAEWQSRRAKELFFFLQCNRRVLTKEEIMDKLWPDSSVDLSSGALRINIFRVRHALFFDCILAKDTGYCINPQISIELDKESFLRGLDLAADPNQREEAREQHLEQAIALYNGPFLSGIYSDWCQELRTDLEIKYHAALMDLATYHTGKKNHRIAARLLETVITTDPYNEQAQYQLLLIFLENKEIGAALQQLRKYAKLCREEMGTDLPPRFIQCHKRIISLLPPQVYDLH